MDAKEMNILYSYCYKTYKERYCNGKDFKLTNVNVNSDPMNDLVELCKDYEMKNNERMANENCSFSSSSSVYSELLDEYDVDEINYKKDHDHSSQFNNNNLHTFISFKPEHVAIKRADNEHIKCNISNSPISSRNTYSKVFDDSSNNASFTNNPYYYNNDYNNDDYNSQPL